MSDNQPAISGQSGANSDPLIGTTLEGRYLIEEVLGTGGVSVVYKAKQLRFNRYVAIKMMKMQFEQNAVHRERFEREIASLSALSHPNIVTVYDYTIGPKDQPCVVMDFLKGRSLETLINEDGPIEIGRFAHIAVQIGGALEHAHRHGVIHRDLKPGNIVLMDEELDFVKVVDFGLARLREENKRLTQTGEFWGSPAYMSPEQCRGKPGDERSDIYSFGAVMFEMITGKDPFFDAGSVLDVLHKHGYVAPPAFADVAPQLRIPEAVEAVVLKCLEKDPDARFQNSREVQNAVIKACSNSLGQDAAAELMSLAQSRGMAAVKSSPPNAVPSQEPGSALSSSVTAGSSAKKLAIYLGVPAVMLGAVFCGTIALQGQHKTPRNEEVPTPGASMPHPGPSQSITKGGTTALQSSSSPTANPPKSRTGNNPSRTPPPGSSATAGSATATSTGMDTGVLKGDTANSESPSMSSSSTNVVSTPSARKLTNDAAAPSSTPKAASRPPAMPIANPATAVKPKSTTSTAATVAKSSSVKSAKSSKPAATTTTAQHAATRKETKLPTASILRQAPATEDGPNLPPLPARGPLGAILSQRRNSAKPVPPLGAIRDRIRQILPPLPPKPAEAPWDELDSMRNKEKK